MLIIDSACDLYCLIIRRVACICISLIIYLPVKTARRREIKSAKFRLATVLQSQRTAIQEAYPRLILKTITHHENTVYFLRARTI